MQIAPEIVAGEIALKRGDVDRAIAHFDRAVRYEDALVYQEPPDWHVPARQNLADRTAGRRIVPAEAETVLWEDLKRNAEHGWTLALLSKALKAQDKFADAALIDARFAKSWKGADAGAHDIGPGVAMVHFTSTALAPVISFAEVTLANGVRLHYAQQGPQSGPAIILLHGYSDSSLSFSRVMPLLPPEQRVIARRSARPWRFRQAGDGYRMSDLADDVIGMMDRLEIPSAVIVGHSMGSFVAQAMVERAAATRVQSRAAGSAPTRRERRRRRIADGGRRTDRSHRRGVRARISVQHRRAAGARGVHGRGDRQQPAHARGDVEERRSPA